MSDNVFDSSYLIPQRRSPRRPSVLPMLVGGLFATLVISGTALLGKWQRAKSAHAANRPRPGGHRLRENDSLAKLRQAIIGNNRDTIVRVFGPPPTTGGYAMGSIVQSGQPEYYRADMWYYPMDPARQRAIAIEFREGVARDAQIIQVPPV